MPIVFDWLVGRAMREVPALPSGFEDKLEAVLDELGGMSESAQLQFFLTAKQALGGETPLEALLWGRAERVLALVRHTFGR